MVITDEIVMIKIICQRGHFRLSISLNDNDSIFQRIRNFCYWYDYYKSHVVWQSVHKIQITLQMTGHAVTK